MKRAWILGLLFATLLFAATACGSSEAASTTESAVDPSTAADSAPSPNAAEEAAPAPSEDPNASAAGYDTNFPLPADVQNFSGGGEEINFGTSLTLEEAISFYRQAFEQMGLTERASLTSITENSFSLVFDGSENGKTLVIQGIDLGNGTTNINIRFEDI